MTGGRGALVGVGAVVTVAAVAGLGGYFAVVGLEEADKLASVIGALVAVVGVAVAVYGLATAPPGGGRRVWLRARADDHSQIEQIGGNARGPSVEEAGHPPGAAREARLRARARRSSRIRQVGGDDRPPVPPATS
ncbi:hypothetical protein [Actinomadura litoris]|uniref:Uncharacterized protein n=1 Tax=Actinomadura litoris TaxID=2678616 RepID=A0A7K1L539_9ACTN|nr:hypothetical protein [Actinomadura litoris]MUN39541.1 hypothetical protein [Actinomadura litoris]